MTSRRTCKATTANGRRCRMMPLVDSDYCWNHDPANTEAAAEARKMGGLRRRREATVRAAYDVEGLGSVEEIRRYAERYAELAMNDTVSLDNGFQRNRLIFYGCQVASSLLKVGELEERVEQLEAAVRSHKDQHSAFDERDELGDRFELPGERP
jgi:hypothetical protein